MVEVEGDMDVTAHAVPEDGKVANWCIKPTLVSSEGHAYTKNQVL